MLVIADLKPLLVEAIADNVLDSLTISFAGYRNIVFANKRTAFTCAWVDNITSG